MRDVLAALQGSSTGRAPELACRRMIDGIIAGHIGYEESIATRRGDPPASVIRVLQGRT